MIVHQDERVGRMDDHRLKDLSRVGERLVDAALTNGADLNEVLFGVKKNHSERFTVEKAHFGAKVGNCFSAINR